MNLSGICLTVGLIGHGVFNHAIRDRHPDFYGLGLLKRIATKEASGRKRIRPLRLGRCLIKRGKGNLLQTKDYPCLINTQQPITCHSRAPTVLATASACSAKKWQ